MSAESRSLSGASLRLSREWTGSGHSGFSPHGLVPANGQDSAQSVDSGTTKRCSQVGQFAKTEPTASEGLVSVRGRGFFTHRGTSRTHRPTPRSLSSHDLYLGARSGSHRTLPSVSDGCRCSLSGFTAVGLTIFLPRHTGAVRHCHGGQTRVHGHRLVYGFSGLEARRGIIGCVRGCACPPGACRQLPPWGCYHCFLTLYNGARSGLVTAAPSGMPTGTFPRKEPARQSPGGPGRCQIPAAVSLSPGVPPGPTGSPRQRSGPQL